VVGHRTPAGLARPQSQRNCNRVSFGRPAFVRGETLWMRMLRLSQFNLVDVIVRRLDEYVLGSRGRGGVALDHNGESTFCRLEANTLPRTQAPVAETIVPLATTT
jgi:hypothetical protein